MVGDLFFEARSYILTEAMKCYVIIMQCYRFFVLILKYVLFNVMCIMALCIMGHAIPKLLRKRVLWAGTVDIAVIIRDLEYVVCGEKHAN